MKYCHYGKEKVMKTKSKSVRFLSIILLITLMVTLMPSSTLALESVSLEKRDEIISSNETEFGMIPKEELNEVTIKSEIVSRREENVKHFDMGNGMYQAVTYGNAVHRKDANGVWQDIDNRLLWDTENSIYSTLDGRIKVASSFGGNDPLISINENGYTISMTPITKSFSTSSVVQISNHQNRNFNDISGASIKDVAQISNSSSIKYSNVFALTDIEYVLDSNDIKENIIVKSQQDSYIYSFNLFVNNLIPILKQSGEIVFLDEETGKEKYHIPAPFMYDATGDLSYDVYYELNEEQDSYIISVIADSDWVNTDNRSFPVTIDPSIKKTILYDTYINSSSPTTNYGTSEELWISAGRISFLKCSMPSLPEGCNLYAAKLNVYYYYYNSITDGVLTAGAYQVMNSWAESGSNGLTWNMAQPNTTAYISSTRLSTCYMSGSNGAYLSSPKVASFDVTSAASSWYANSSANYGIALKYESGTNASVILKSYEAGSDYRAYFVVTYTEPQIISGVYRIKNAKNGLYLDITGGGYSTGTEIQQWSEAEAGFERNQLFKVTFVRTFGDSEQLNYYTIRPMTNNAMGLESPLSGTSRNVTIGTMSSSDDWNSILYKQSWAISKNGNYYTIKNGRVSVSSYLTAPSNTINGEPIFTSDSITDYSKWIFEPYTGEDLYGVAWTSYVSTLFVGERFSYGGIMYDQDVGKNGPLKYDVTNIDDSETDKATIDLDSGLLRAIKPGQVKVNITYDGAPRIWSSIIEIKPNFVETLINKGCISFTDIKYTDDGFYMLTKSLADILTDANINTLAQDITNLEPRDVMDYYDDWYIFAVESSEGYNYGMLKMREPENDGIDGDITGITVSFVGFSYDKLTALINYNTTANSYSYFQDLEKVTGPGSYDYDEVISEYFAKVESKAPYLIAEQFIQIIVNKKCVNGIINAPVNYIAIFEEIEEIDELLDNIWLPSETRLALINKKNDLLRIPNALDDNNTVAGCFVYNTTTNTINISNPNNLTMYEKYAILATHTGNVTFNSFAAEVEFHADALYDWKANHPCYYEKALRADMAVGEEDESGIFDEYYKLNSDIVRAQAAIHGEY